MLRAGIIACVVCVGAGGSAMWVNERKVQSQETLKGMPTLLELHNGAHLENLPVQDVKDPF